MKTKTKKSAIDTFDMDFSDVIDNTKNPALAIINKEEAKEKEMVPEEQNDEEASQEVLSVEARYDKPKLEKERKTRKNPKGKNQFLSIEELIEGGGKNTDIKYVRLNSETFSLIQKVKTRYGITIQDLVNTATYSACKQILDRK
jgi:NRPS condensation-like uncharacterized protein